MKIRKLGAIKTNSKIVTNASIPPYQNRNKIQFSQPFLGIVCAPIFYLVFDATNSWFWRLTFLTKDENNNKSNGKFLPTYNYNPFEPYYDEFFLIRYAYLILSHDITIWLTLHWCATDSEKKNSFFLIHWRRLASFSIKSSFRS